MWGLFFILIVSVAYAAFVSKKEAFSSFKVEIPVSSIALPDFKIQQCMSDANDHLNKAIDRATPLKPQLRQACRLLRSIKIFN